MPIGPVFYFGAWSPNRVGHFLYKPDGVQVGQRDEGTPLFNHSLLDGGMLPPGKDQPQGKVHRTVFAGWTVVSFWDRSADSRANSNSSFLAEGDHSTVELLAAARVAFPTVFKRLPFELGGGS